MLEVALSQRAPIPLECRFDCAPGELVALVGPSGSGKTTVLRCIAGLQRATVGVITCNSVRWADDRRHLPPQQRRIGLVFQHYALLPHLTALGNVMLALTHLPAAERQRQARDCLTRVRLGGLAEQHPGQLSGGEQQRVALARALARVATEPSGVLLLDEPFSAVDQVTRRQLQAELARLRRDLHIPVVLVTHDLDEARQLADRMIVLNQGEAIQQGAPEEVMRRPGTPVVARVLGLNNVFRGTLGHDEGHASVDWAGYRIVSTAPARQKTGVNWVIPAEGVSLCRDESLENRIRGVLTEALPMGATLQLTLMIAGESQPLVFRVNKSGLPTLTVGQELAVRLDPHAVFIMP